MRLRYLVVAFASAALLGGCSFSLAQDVTPPPNSEISNRTATTIATTLPVSPTPTGGDVQPSAMDAKGIVKNGSSGDLPTGALITLYALDHSQGQDLFTRTTTLQGDGEFLFSALPMDAKNLYQVSIEYKGLIYFSEYLTETDLQTGKKFELMVYEGTQDTSKLVISSLNLVFDFLVEGQVKVVEQVLLSNTGILAVVPAKDGQALLHYELPSGASNLTFGQGQIGDRYELVSGGFSDYRAVLPGENSYEVLYAFDLDYDRALEFVRAVEFPAQNVHVILPKNEVELRGDSLVLTGEQLVNSVPYRVYQLNRGLGAGEHIALRLTGTHPLKKPFLIQISGDGLVIALIALAITGGIAAFWLRRSSRAGAAGNSPNQIMDAIIILDEQFEKKEISENKYKRERARLKKCLELALKKGDEL